MNALGKLDLREISRLLPEIERSVSNGSDCAPLFQMARDAWQNPSAPPADFLTAAYHCSRRSRIGMIECGSGLTTLFLAHLASKSGISFVALEHDEYWFAVTQKALRYLGLSTQYVVHAALRPYLEFDWYDIAPEVGAGRYDLVICDGPPQATRGGRVGLMPVLHGALAAGCTILLDDFDRAREQEIVHAWTLAHGLSADRTSGRFISLRMP